MLRIKTSFALAALVSFGCSAGTGSDPAAGPPAEAVRPDAVKPETPAAAPAGPPSAPGCLSISGICEAKEMVTGLRNPRTIVHGAGAVWVGTSEGLLRLEGGGQKMFRTASPGSHLAVTDGMVAWDDSDDLMAFAPGGSESPRRIDRDNGRIEWLALTTSGGRFFLHRGGVVSSFDASDTQVRFEASVCGWLRSMAVDGPAIYYACTRDYDALEIWVRSQGDARKLTTLDDVSWAPAIALTATHVFFPSPDDRTIRAVPREGGEAVVVAPGQGDTFRITSDDSGVYWASIAGVHWSAPDGSATRLLAKVDWQGFPGYVATSDEAIYFTAPGRGAVYRVAK